MRQGEIDSEGPPGQAEHRDLPFALELEVLRRQGDVIRLPARALSENDVYLASPDVEVTRTNRLEALRHLSDVLATRVADRLEWMSRPAIPPKAPGAAGG